MKEFVTRELLDILNVDEQLKFYQEQFGYQHCELDGCGNEVGYDWVLFSGEIYCNSCYEFMRQEEKKEIEDEIKRLEKELLDAKSRLAVI